MTARDLLLRQCANLERQILLATEGLTPEEAEGRTSPASYSIADHVAHLVETCVALDAHRNGESYVWGTGWPRDATWPAVRDEWRSRRAKTIAATPDDEEGLLLTSGYLAEHDGYHLGSIVAARFVVQPTWDSDVLYE